MKNIESKNTFLGRGEGTGFYCDHGKFEMPIRYKSEDIKLSRNYMS